MAINQLQLPNAIPSAQADWSPLANLANVYQQGNQQRARQEALASLGNGSGPINYEEGARRLLAAGDREGAMSLAQLAMTNEQRQYQRGRDVSQDAFRAQEAQRAQSNADRSYGLQERLASNRDKPAAVQILEAAGLDPKSPEGRKALFPRTDTPISATDKKEVFKAEDELPNIQGTIEALKLAKDLNNKTFTGYTANLRGSIGTKLPGGGFLVDKDAAMATSEFGKVMSGEAIKTMADTLKGATTDFELKKFETMLADPTTPPEIRGRVIDRMISLAERQRAVKERRIRDLPGGRYFKEGVAAPAQGATAPTPAANQYRDGQRAKNASGQVIEFRGGQWVPVQ